MGGGRWQDHLVTKRHAPEPPQVLPRDYLGTASCVDRREANMPTHATVLVFAGVLTTLVGRTSNVDAQSRRYLRSRSAYID